MYQGLQCPQYKKIGQGVKYKCVGECRQDYDIFVFYLWNGFPLLAKMQEEKYEADLQKQREDLWEQREKDAFDD